MTTSQKLRLGFGPLRRSHEAVFDHHMVKPVDPAALEKLLAGLRRTGVEA
jgi:hypothetical protein